MENITKNSEVEREIEGRTIKEAVQKALEIFKVSKSQLVIRVLSEEKKGLFGMQGAKPAKISVRLKSKEAPRKKP